MYIFGYGSLRNPRSRALTLPGERSVIETTLRGYARKFNAPVNGYLYLNIVQKSDACVQGTLIRVSDEELERVKLREIGYECIDVSQLIENPQALSAFAFVAPNNSYASMKIPRSYINTCLSDLPKSEKDTWLSDTIIENEIEEDSNNPVYVNSA